MSTVHVVVGGQFGSEAKGAITAHACRDMGSRDVNIRVAGPNAGHTVYNAEGREFKLRTIPVGAVASDHCQLHIAAGSEVDPYVLLKEIHELEDAGVKRLRQRLTIHPSATILLPRNAEVEAELGLIARIGSTGKGIGHARADRIMRIAPTWGEYAEQHGDEFRQLTSAPGPFDLGASADVVIEGTQGYGLGLHTEQYPQVTSSDCRAVDFLAMAGISPWDFRVDELHVTVVARTFPIRVAGNSGPLKNETTWADLGLPEERTTVTNNVRRVGGWDLGLVREAIAANGGGEWHDTVSLAMTMLDQRFPEVAGAVSQGELSEAALTWLREIEDELATEITAVGTGPRSHFEVSLA